MDTNNGTIIGYCIQVNMYLHSYIFVHQYCVDVKPQQILFENKNNWSDRRTLFIFVRYYTFHFLFTHNQWKLLSVLFFPFIIFPQISVFCSIFSFGLEELLHLGPPTYFKIYVNILPKSSHLHSSVYFFLLYKYSYQQLSFLQNDSWKMVEN